MRQNELQFALLRSVNVGGRNKIAMAALRGFFEDLGFAAVQSYIQSGNIVFGAKDLKATEAEVLLEREAKKRLGLNTSFFVRSFKEWSQILRANPFLDEARKDPSHLVVLLLKDATSAKSVASLQAAISGPERVEGQGRHVYIYYPAGIGTSRLTNAVIEAKLGTEATGRNWNTAMKLRALAETAAS